MFYLIGLLLCFTVGIFILKIIVNLSMKINQIILFIALIIICFLVKFAWIWFNRIEPLVDYATFYYTAVDLSEHTTINRRYVALFPHIFGYSHFLSLFMKIFSSSYFIPPVLNVVLSTISMTLIYFICKKVSGLKSAVVASLLWITFPSQTIYNMFALSEPLYTTLLLASIALMIVIKEKLDKIGLMKLFGLAVILAALLAYMNMARPIAVIPIIALGIWLFVIDSNHIGNQKLFIRKVFYFFIVLIAYSSLTNMSNQYVSYRLGEEIATIPGYNIHVGFNMDSLGRWNQEDSDLLFYYNDLDDWTAKDVQEQMLEEAKKRIFSGDINFFQLLINKFFIFLGSDSAAVDYGSSVIDHPLRLTIISDVFYYFLIITSLIAVISFIKQKNRSALIVLCLYVIGLTMAQMLVEVASRYHYLLTISIVIRFSWN